MSLMLNTGAMQYKADGSSGWQPLTLVANVDLESLADEFSTSSTYEVGEYVRRGGVMYRCITAVTTAGAWDSTKWVEVNIGDELESIKASLGKVRKRNFILIGDSFGRGITPNVSESEWKGWQYWFEDAFGDIYVIHSCLTGGAGESGFASSLPFLTMLQASESAYASFADEVTDIVVLGGTNDDASNASAIESAIASFCSYCATQYPNATVKIGCLGSDFGKMYSMGNIYQRCTKYGAIYLPDGRALYSDTSLISSDNTHLTQVGYETYKEYTNNLIANGCCHFVFRKTPEVTVTCGTASASTYLEVVITENTVGMNLIPPSGTTIAVSNTSLPAYGYTQFGTFTMPFNNIPYLKQNYFINGLNIHRSSSGDYAVCGNITLQVTPQTTPYPKIVAYINSMGTFTNADIRGGCVPVMLPY